MEFPAVLGVFPGEGVNLQKSAKICVLGSLSLSLSLSRQFRPLKRSQKDLAQGSANNLQSAPAELPK